MALKIRKLNLRYVRSCGGVILVIGFLWLAVHVVKGRTDHSQEWNAQIQRLLPPEPMIQRTIAVEAMEDLARKVANRSIVLILPALMMLLGGMLLAFPDYEIHEDE